MTDDEARLIEAQREVDAMLPHTPRIAPFVVSAEFAASRHLAKACAEAGVSVADALRVVTYVVDDPKLHRR